MSTIDAMPLDDWEGEGMCEECGTQYVEDWATICKECSNNNN